MRFDFQTVLNIFYQIWPIVLLGLSIAAGAGVLRWFSLWVNAFLENHRSKLREFRRDDDDMIQSAVRKVGDDERQVSVIRGRFGRELDRASVEAVRVSAFVSIVALVQVACNALVLLINATGLTPPGVSLQTSSVFVATIATICIGLSAALHWDERKVAATKAMQELRREIWAFIADALVYQAKSAPDRWQIVNQQIDNILNRYFSGEQTEPEGKPKCDDCEEEPSE